MPENSTPDTLSYLVLGIVAVVGILLVYMIGMIARARTLRRDVEMLYRLENE